MMKRMMRGNSLAVMLTCCVAAPGMTQTIAPAPTPTTPVPAAVAPLTPSQIIPGTAAVPPAPPVAPPPAPPPRLDKLSPLGTKPDWLRLQSFHQSMTRVEFEAALRDIYSDGSPMTPPWKMEPDGVVIQTCISAAAGACDIEL